MSFVSHPLALVVSLLLAPGVLPSSASVWQQDAPNPNIVRVFVSAVDKNGQMITTLTRSDLRVFDDDKPQTILSFDHLTEHPISVAVLIDTSLSLGRLEQTSKLTARSFVESLMQSGRDQIAIIGFTGKTAAAAELTTDKAQALQAIDRLHFATPASIGVGAILSGRNLPDDDAEVNASSAIWSAIWNASEGLSVSSTAGTRRAVLLLSDGEDTFSRRSIGEAIERAQKHDVAIYAIGMGDNAYNKVRQSTLKKLAEETGGRAFFPKHIPELQNIFAQLNEELHAPYLLTYARTNRRPRGEMQRLKIQITSPGLRDVKVDHRRGYVSL